MVILPLTFMRMKRVITSAAEHIYFLSQESFPPGFTQVLTPNFGRTYLLSTYQATTITAITINSFILPPCTLLLATHSRLRSSAQIFLFRGLVSKDYAQGSTIYSASGFQSR